jgi:3-dehydroquinate synthase
MKELKFKHKEKVERIYHVVVGRDLKEHIASEFIELKCKYFIVTDNVVKKICAERLYNYLKEKNVSVELIVLDSGEKTKSVESFGKLSEELYSKGADNSSCIVAVGGGVIGDLAGFVASSYLGGVKLVQVPTTLLACVDSALSPKNTINLSSAKNYIYSEKHADRVYIDLDHLETLPRTEVSSGVAEIIKYGLIWDKGLFKYLEKNYEDILFMDEKHIIKLIEWAVTVNDKVHSSHDKRILLALGHTIGHALESLTGFKKLRHGEAVAIGIVACAYLCRHTRYLFKGELERIVNVIKAYKLPYKLPSGVKAEEVVAAMRKDSKCCDNRLEMILLKSIGSAKHKGGYLIEVSEEFLLQAFADMENEDIK